MDDLRPEEMENNIANVTKSDREFWGSAEPPEAFGNASTKANKKLTWAKRNQGNGTLPQVVQTFI